MYENVVVIIYHLHYDSFSMVCKVLTLPHKNNVHGNAFLNW